jgi:hypothetical protein
MVFNPPFLTANELATSLFISGTSCFGKKLLMTTLATKHAICILALTWPAKNTRRRQRKTEDSAHRQEENRIYSIILANNKGIEQNFNHLRIGIK